VDENASGVSPDAYLERIGVYSGEFRDTSLELWSVGDPSKHAEEQWVLAHEAPQRHLISLINLDVKILIRMFTCGQVDSQQDQTSTGEGDPTNLLI